MAVPRRNVAYNKPAEPSFLRAFKQKVGYKEPETIESKFDPPKIDESKLDDREDRAEEQPTVVALRPGDLTQEEYDEIRKKEDVEDSTSREVEHLASQSSQEPSQDSTEDESKKVGCMNITACSFVLGSLMCDLTSIHIISMCARFVLMCCTCL